LLRPAGVFVSTGRATGTMPVIQDTRIGEDETAMLTTQRHDRRVRRRAGLLLEPLDDRLLLSGGAWGATAEALVHYQPANDAQRYERISPREVSPAALPASLSAALRSRYVAYEDLVRDSRSTPGLPGDGVLSIRGSTVAVRIKVAFPPALGADLRALRSDGLQTIRTVPADGLVEGMLPVAKLPAVANLAAHVWPASLPNKG
jgi:hypothetical protein